MGEMSAGPFLSDLPVAPSSVARDLRRPFGMRANPKFGLWIDGWISCTSQFGDRCFGAPGVFLNCIFELRYVDHNIEGDDELKKRDSTY